ncbi:MAG TPA: AAA-associated domain-containing protein [Acidobacteriaceae bacterium]|nr:AAA-associated domain-containing protein [Acidobacteriaceae bacterium]
MTNPEAVVEETPALAVKPRKRFSRLPHARSGGITGLLEIIHDRGGREVLPELANDFRLEIDDLLPAIDASALLGFASVAEGDVIITNIGNEFAMAGIHRSHEIFNEQLLSRVPLAATVVKVLEGKRDGWISKEFLLDILEEHFSDEEAEKQFQTLIDWGPLRIPF